MQDPKKQNNQPKIVGRAEHIHFPELGFYDVPARIDTGARTATVWASNIEAVNGILHFTLFDTPSPLYTGEKHTTSDFDEIMVASSNGAVQRRYAVKLLVKLRGKKIRATFTLANRSTQAFPVLIGRNVLLGKFLVDSKKVKKKLKQIEARRIDELQSRLKDLT